MGLPGNGHAYLRVHWKLQKMMKTPAITVVSFLHPTAFAVVQVADVDTNDGGMVSFEEPISVYMDVTEEQFAKMDIDRDGSLDADKMSVELDAGMHVMTE